MDVDARRVAARICGERYVKPCDAPATAAGAATAFGVLCPRVVKGEDAGGGCVRDSNFDRRLGGGCKGSPRLLHGRDGLFRWLLLLLLPLLLLLRVAVLFLPPFFCGDARLALRGGISFSSFFFFSLPTFPFLAMIIHQGPNTEELVCVCVCVCGIYAGDAAATKCRRTKRTITNQCVCVYTKRGRIKKRKQRT